jgi:putative FmdB family regulatory protein
MPRYPYECTACEHTETHFHSFSDAVGSCPACGCTTYTKLVGRAYIPRASSVEVEEKAGTKTKEYIEANRELLKDMKTESSEELYESS